MHAAEPMGDSEDREKESSVIEVYRITYVSCDKIQSLNHHYINLRRKKGICARCHNGKQAKERSYGELLKHFNNIMNG